MSTARRRKLSAVDTAWLRMDRPRNLMMISGVLMFASASRCARLLQASSSERFLAFPRFRQRPVRDAGRRVLGDATRNSTSTAHVRAALPGRAGQARAAGASSQLAWHAARPGRPLWQFHLVDDYERRQRADRAHPPLLRRRHRARAGDAVDDRRRRDGPPAMPFDADDAARAARTRRIRWRADRSRSRTSMKIARQARRDADREGRRRSGTTRRRRSRSPSRAARSPRRSRGSR